MRTVNQDGLRSRLAFGLPALLSLSLMGSMALAQKQPAGASRVDAQQAHADTHIIVKFAPGALDVRSIRTAYRASRNDKGQNVRFRTGPPAELSRDVATVWQNHGIRGMKPLHIEEFGNIASAEKHGLNRTFVLELPDGADAAGVAAALAPFGDQIESAEVDVWGEVAQLIPNDPDFCKQWGMHNTGSYCASIPLGVADADIDAPEAWAIHTGDIGTVTVAIIDSGVDPHPEYVDRMVPGWNTVTDTDATEDGCRHGTHVAGIVAAAGNNAEGVAGMSWGANIMPVRVFTAAYPCDYLDASEVAEGIRWAVDHGADICNISLQLWTGLTALEDAVNYAYDAGVLVVSAAGNYTQRTFYPARYANSMAISATTSSDTLYYRSNRGPEIDVAAPGVDIWSTWTVDICEGGTNPGAACVYDSQCYSGGICAGVVSTYKLREGTSMATPHVSGLAALMLSYNPTLTHSEIWSLITMTAEDLGSPGRDIYFGDGRINAHRAMLFAAPWPRIITSLPASSSIDARQPSEPDGSGRTGWQWVDLKFYRDASGLTAADFTITEDGLVDPTLYPLAVTASPAAGYVRVIFSRAIAPLSWTEITHDESGSSVRLGFLPGDVNSSRVADQTDIQSLIDALSGTGDPLPEWRFDIDRSGQVAPADLLRAIDLLNGAGMYDTYLDAQLAP